MEEKDLKQISEVVREAVKSGFQEEFPKAFQRSFAEVWEGNLEPAFENVHNDLDSLRGNLKTIEIKLDRALYAELVHLEA